VNQNYGVSRYRSTSTSLRDFLLPSPRFTTLVNSDGAVICAWPGGNEIKAIRDRMAQQIVADTLIAANTASVLTSKTSANH
jgi:hypothetical protein